MAHHYFLPPAIATTMLVIFLFLSPPTAANSVVVDTDGNPLEVGSRYYVLTAGTRGAGRGGLTFIPKARLCPNYVVQLWSEMQKGNPVSLFPANQTQKQISEGKEVAISFGTNGICRDFGIWRVTLDSKTMIPYVATDGGSLWSEYGFSWFKIEKASADKDYKIVYCFEVPKPGGKLKDEICQQLDATPPVPGGFSFLSLVPVDNPLPFFGFVFQKADATPTTITTTTY